MRTRAIVMRDHPTSEYGFKNLVSSADKFGIEVERFDATLAEEAEKQMTDFGLRWNWPWEGEVIDIHSGLTKRAYPTKDKRARIACFLSHYRLWKECVDTNENTIVLEHDAFFLKAFDDSFKVSGTVVLSLNDPRGCTRRSDVFHTALQTSGKVITETPWVDEKNIPQGLPGNSAYLITTQGAISMLRLVDEYGAWPNDAIMCKQLFPGKLYSFVDYVTTVQKLQSTSSR